MSGKDVRTNVSSRFKYSQENLVRAVQAVKLKTHKLSNAAREFGIPKGTLSKKVRGLTPLTRKMGPPTVLSAEVERKIADWIISKAKVGFPIHPESIFDSVQKILVDSNAKTPFTESRPGKKWFRLFMQRHPNIVKRNAEIISKARASVTEKALRNWFSEVQQFCVNENCEDVLLEPTRIYNADEMGVQLCPKSGKLLGPKSYRNFYEISSGPEKQSITVLCNYSAAGQAVPSMIVLPYKRIPRDIADSFPDDYFSGRSDSGWMTSDVFFEYIANCFYPWLLEKNVTFPIILFIDGHKSHLNLALSNFCSEKQIILYCLYPNATHILQPCDVAIFKTVKTEWRKVVRKYKQDTGKYITKVKFAPLFKAAHDQLSTETIKNGFKRCGLFPFDPNAVEYEKCISVRQEELNKQKCEAIDRDDIQTALKVLNIYLTDDQKDNFRSVKSSNQLYDDSLYKFWNFCNDHVQEKVDSSESFNNLVFTEDDLDLMPVEFDDITISNEVLLLEDGADCSVLASDNTTISTTESTETVGATNDLNILTEKNMSEPNDNINAKTNLEHGILNSAFNRNYSDDRCDNIDIESKGTDEPILNQNDIIKIKHDKLMEKNEGKHSQEAFRAEAVSQIRTKEISEISYNVILDNSDKLVKTEENAKDNNSVVTQKTDELLNTQVDNKLDSGIEKNLEEKIEIKKPKINVLSDICINPSLWVKHLTINDYDNKTATNAQKFKKTYMPYAVTSKKFKEYCKQKYETKKQKAQEVENRKLQRTLNKLRKEKLKNTDKTNKKKKVSTKENNNNNFSRRNQTKTSSKTKKNKAVNAKRDKKDLDDDELPLASLQEKYNVGDYVIVCYEKKQYPGVIKKYDNRSEFEVSVMERRLNSLWKWPIIPDQIWYPEKDIVKKIEQPIPVNSRKLFFKVPELQ